MQWWRCFACGENFPLEIEGAVRLCGFFTTRYVQAADAAAAEARAAEMLFTDPDLALPEEAAPHPEQRIYFESVDCVEAEEAAPGFAFFPMEEEAH
ncbi:MAG TPA: hypothetical protein PLS69_12360 [Terricaulis sp.]|nr:hypothetical protein [Terricaulis sp.]HRP10599.1 hypothetical protein [Terricaulis sp.]